MIQNAVLARLWFLLRGLSPGIEQMVGNLADGCPPLLQTDIWNALNKSNINEKWAVDRDSWDLLDADRKLIIFAAYLDTISSVPPIADQWVRSGSSLKKKAKVSQSKISTEWQTAGAVSDSEDDYVDEFDVFVSRSNAPFDEDFSTEELDSSTAEFDRNLDDDDDDDDYYFCWDSTSAKQSNEDLVHTISSRPSSANTISHFEFDLLKKLSRKSMWKLSKQERIQLFSIWVKILKDDAIRDVAKYQSDFRRASSVDNLYNDRVDANALRSADVVGMTTNGAAKYNSLLRVLQPEIIVVEEAAEILEANIIAAITPETKQIILIGDHLQLRP